MQHKKRPSTLLGALFVLYVPVLPAEGSYNTEHPDISKKWKGILVFTLLTTDYFLLTIHTHSFVSSKLPSLRHVRHHLRMNAISCHVLS